MPVARAAVAADLIVALSSVALLRIQAASEPATYSGATELTRQPAASVVFLPNIDG
jgi:hypothetical protein